MNGMNGMHRMQFDPLHLDFLSLVSDRETHVLTIYHMKLAQSTALEQKCFDLRLLLPTPCNLWLPLVLLLLLSSF